MPRSRDSISKSVSFSRILISEEESFFLKFLYHTKIGRGILWVLIRPSFSKMIGSLFNTKFSSLFIPGFIRRHQIDLSRFEEKKYISFNDFFTRRLNLNEVFEENFFRACCDGKLSFYSITNDLTFEVKHSIYSLKTLLQDEKLAKRYEQGTCLVFRLTPEDYHRYHFIDEGEIVEKYPISGVFHTVRPIAFQNFKVFHENAREVTVMKTKHFKQITQVEVGALLVGKIKNHEQKNFKQDEEKGMFLFGGSTIILLVEKNVVDWNPIFPLNTQNGYETVVRYQDILGRRNK